MTRKTSAIALFSLMLLLGGCASNNEATLTQSNSQQSLPQNVSATATITKSGLATQKVINKQVVGYGFHKGFVIPAKIGNFFGFSYNATQTIALTPDSTGGEILTRLPVVVEVTHPSINGSTSSQWNDTLYFGRPNYAMWQFESEKELVNGEWNIAVKLNGEIIAERSFFVQIPQRLPAKVSKVCEVEIELFPKALQDVHSSCCADNDSKACYKFAWLGLELINDKNGSLLYYAKSCESGYISGCRSAAKLATSQEQKLDFYNKGCELKDFESCINAELEF